MGKPRLPPLAELIDADFAAWRAVCLRENVRPLILLATTLSSSDELETACLWPQDIDPLEVATLLLTEARLIASGRHGRRMYIDETGQSQHRADVPRAN